VTALASPEFHLYGPSHWAVLIITAAGALAWVRLGRHASESLVRVWCRLLAAAIFLLNVGTEWWVFQPTNPVYTLPLQLSDLAPYAAAIALWTWRRWAFSLTDYWCLTLSTQALLTPVLRGPDFPSLSFVAFFANHVLVVWAAILLIWGLRLRPGWRDYWFTVMVTGCWAIAMLILNAFAGTDYGFLNAKPATGSLLDLFGPWPWYLLPEFALILGGWAALTVWWQRPSMTSPTQPRMSNY